MKKVILPNPNNLEQWGPIDMRLLYPSFWFAPMSGAAKSKWGIYWAEMVGIIKNDTGTFYWWKNSLEKEGIKSIKKWLLPDVKRKQVSNAYWKNVAQIKTVVDQLEKLGPNADFGKVRNLALNWQSLYYKFWGIADVFEVANYGAPIFLKNALIKLVPQAELGSIMEVLMAPDKLSFNQQSEKELLQCALNAQSKESLKQLIKKHAEKWHWLDNSYYASKRLTPAHFLKKINNLSKTDAKVKLSEIEKYSKTVRQKKKEVIKKFKLPPIIVKLASVITFSIWMQDHRKGVAWWSSHIETIFSKHLAKQIKVPLQDILHYSADEWIKTYKTGKKLNEKILGARKNKLYVMYSRRGFYTFLTGIEAKRIAKHFEKLHQHNHKNTSNILAGTVVSKGPKIIHGTVRVLHSPRDSKKMKQGEILVTAMTSPDYIHAMRLAKAIITDTGGLMSHAAVVSRELGIPCIVGTKFATKVFKDGDMVEVDANKGIVRKIK